MHQSGSGKSPRHDFSPSAAGAGGGWRRRGARGGVTRVSRTAGAVTSRVGRCYSGGRHAVVVKVGTLLEREPARTGADVAGPSALEKCAVREFYWGVPDVGTGRHRVKWLHSSSHPSIAEAQPTHASHIHPRRHALEKERPLVLPAASVHPAPPHARASLRQVEVVHQLLMLLCDALRQKWRDHTSRSHM